MTLNVIYRLRVFSIAIRRTFAQHFTRFQLTACSHGSSASAELLAMITSVTKRPYFTNFSSMFWKNAISVKRTCSLNLLYFPYLQCLLSVPSSLWNRRRIQILRFWKIRNQFSPHFAQLEVLISDNRHYRVVFVSATTTSEQLHDLSAYFKPTDCYRGVYAVAKIALLFTSKLRASRFEGVSRGAGPSFRIKQDHL